MRVQLQIRLKGWKLHTDNKISRETKEENSQPRNHHTQIMITGVAKATNFQPKRKPFRKRMKRRRTTPHGNITQSVYYLDTARPHTRERERSNLEDDGDGATARWRRWLSGAKWRERRRELVFRFFCFFVRSAYVGFASLPKFHKITKWAGSGRTQPNPGVGYWPDPGPDPPAYIWNQARPDFLHQHGFRNFKLKSTHESFKLGVITSWSGPISKWNWESDQEDRFPKMGVLDSQHKTWTGWS